MALKDIYICIWKYWEALISVIDHHPYWAHNVVIIPHVYKAVKSVIDG